VTYSYAQVARMSESRLLHSVCLQVQRRQHKTASAQQDAAPLAWTHRWQAAGRPELFGAGGYRPVDVWDASVVDAVHLERRAGDLMLGSPCMGLFAGAEHFVPPARPAPRQRNRPVRGELTSRWPMQLPRCTASATLAPQTSSSMMAVRAPAAPPPASASLRQRSLPTCAQAPGIGLLHALDAGQAPGLTGELLHGPMMSSGSQSGRNQACTPARRVATVT